MPPSTMRRWWWVSSADRPPPSGAPSVPPPDEAPHDPATLRGVAVGGYQNHDLMALVGLPHGSAVYTVHLELGSTRSNEVTVEIAAQP